MLERGTAKHDRQAFADALDKLRAKLDIGGGGATVAVDATTVRGSVPDVLRLAAEALREPAFVPAEFEQLKRERLTALEQSRTDPTAIARRAAARAGNPYPPDDVRYTPTIDEEIDRVQRDRSRGRQGVPREVLRRVARRAGHRRRFRRGRGAARWCASCSATSRARRRTRACRSRFYPTKAAPQTFETPDKANAAMFGRLSLPLNDEAAGLSRRWSSPIGFSAATATRGSSSASA